MLRIVTLTLGFVALSYLSPACAQVTQQDENLQEQLVPDSFKIEASAVASKFNWLWNTTVSYTVTNNSGMNLYLGVMRGGVTIGSCTDAQENNPMQGPPRGAFVPSGGRAAGAIVVYNCPAPNPGYATAPLSISLLVGKSQSFQTMTTFPLSVDAPVRQLQSQ